jgi:membrane associated rhomboid family serine protease
MAPAVGCCVAIHERVWERSDAGRSPSPPPAPRPWRPEGTYTLLAVIAGMYVLQQVVQAYQDARVHALLAGQGGFVPAVLYGGRPVTLADWLFVIHTDWPLRPWTLLTSTLSHDVGHFTHILFNGLFLFFFGPTVERLVGRTRFLTLFLLAGALSGIVQVHLSAALGDPRGALGASGALMMLFGLVMVVLPRQKILVYGIIPVPMWAAGIGYAALDVLGAFNPYSSVGNFAHLSGLALGMGYGMWQKQDWKRRGMRLTTT